MGQGRVIQPPAAPASEQQLDGVLVYNEGQHSFNCSFGAFQVSLGCNQAATACI